MRIEVCERVVRVMLTMGWVQKETQLLDGWPHVCYITDWLITTAETKHWLIDWLRRLIKHWLITKLRQGRWDTQFTFNSYFGAWVCSTNPVQTLKPPIWSSYQSNYCASYNHPSSDLGCWIVRQVHTTPGARVALDRTGTFSNSGSFTLGLDLGLSLSLGKGE